MTDTDKVTTPETPTPKFIPPCVFIGAESKKDEIACVLYQRWIPRETCNRDCQGYRAWKGSA